MTTDEANDFLDTMLKAAIMVAKESVTIHTVKINTHSVSLHYYPLSRTHNWFFRGCGVSNKGDVRRRLEAIR